MKLLWLFLAVGVNILASAANAGLTRGALGDVGVDTGPDKRIPANSHWLDERGRSVRLGDILNGRPAILIFADFTCTTLCGPVLSVTASALAQARLKPQRDYHLLVLGLDDKDTAEDARRMRRLQIGDSPVAPAVTFLRATKDEVKRVADAVGYRFHYDPEQDQFAHPAAVLVLSADGHVSRAIDGLGLTGPDLNLALVEAGQGAVGTLRDHVQLLCYAFDPAVGVYTLSVYRGLSLAAGITVLVVAAGLFILARRSPDKWT